MQLKKTLLNGAMTGWIALVLMAPASARGVDINPDSPIAEALRKAEASVQTIIALPESQRNFDNVIGGIDDIVAHLQIDTNMLQFMKHVSTNAAERERGGKAEEDFLSLIHI